MDFPEKNEPEIDAEQAERDRIAKNPWSHKEVLEARKNLMK